MEIQSKRVTVAQMRHQRTTAPRLHTLKQRALLPSTSGTRSADADALGKMRHRDSVTSSALHLEMTQKEAGGWGWAVEKEGPSTTLRKIQGATKHGGPGDP